MGKRIGYLYLTQFWWDCNRVPRKLILLLQLQKSNSYPTATEKHDRFHDLRVDFSSGEKSSEMNVLFNSNGLRNLLEEKDFDT